MDLNSSIFYGTEDRFGGVTVDSTKFYNCTDIQEKIKNSIKSWVESKKRCIWFKVHTDQSVWIPILAQNDFDFHHAKPGFVMMNKWLSTDEPAHIPEFAHTLVGVGGLVVNDSNEILVVSDKRALIPNSWKLPGGYVEYEEDITDAAIREVFEETGIKCKFHTMLNVRQSHGGNYECSDLYFVVGLIPLNKELKRCEREIAKVEWMPVDEYLEHPNVHATNRNFLKTYLEYKKLGIVFDCQKRSHPILKKDYCLYFVKTDV